MFDMDDRKNIKERLQPDRIGFSCIIQEMPVVAAKNRSRKKANLIYILSQKASEIFRNLNREIIGGPK